MRWDPCQGWGDGLLQGCSCLAMTPSEMVDLPAGRAEMCQAVATVKQVQVRDPQAWPVWGSDTERWRYGR
jgi:hypothetical protein